MSEPKSPMEQYNERLQEWDKENLRSILKEKWGQGFLWRLLEECYVQGEPTVFDNANATYFNLGKQSVGKKLLTQILEINTDAYTEMTKIGKKEKKQAKEASELDMKEKEKEND